MCPRARPHGPTHLFGLLILTANIPKVQEEATWFLDYFLAKDVEVGRVWLELPSPIILLNQIQAVLGNPIQLGL